MLLRWSHPRVSAGHVCVSVHGQVVGPKVCVCYAELADNENMIEVHVAGAELQCATGPNFASFVELDFFGHATQATPVVQGPRFVWSPCHQIGHHAPWLALHTITLHYQRTGLHPTKPPWFRKPWMHAACVHSAVAANLHKMQNVYISFSHVLPASMRCWSMLCKQHPMQHYAGVKAFVQAAF